MRNDLCHKVVPVVLERSLGRLPEDLSWTFQPLRGGLESDAVLDVRAGFLDERGRRRQTRFVVKHLSGDAAREATVYQRLVSQYAADLAPKVIAHSEVDGRPVLVLEVIRRAQAWPWRDVDLTHSVLDRLSAVHAATDAAESLPSWNYEAELEDVAERTLEAFERARRIPALSSALAGRSGPLRRVARSLRPLRRALLTHPVLGAGPIHGDLHPGNVLMRRRGARLEPVLIDWGRARVGSPLEDVSSWLQSLGYFEPEAKRRHDTLLSGYLVSRGLSGKLTSELRTAYWLAGASNALAGALMYHLLVAADPSRSDRDASLAAAVDWLRVVRRADAQWNEV